MLHDTLMWLKCSGYAIYFLKHGSWVVIQLVFSYVIARCDSVCCLICSIKWFFLFDVACTFVYLSNLIYLSISSPIYLFQWLVRYPMLFSHFFLLNCLSAAVINTSLALFAIASGSSSCMSRRRVAYLFRLRLSLQFQNQSEWGESQFFVYYFMSHAHREKLMVRVTICTWEGFDIQHWSSSLSFYKHETYLVSCVSIRWCPCVESQLCLLKQNIRNHQVILYSEILQSVSIWISFSQSI